MKKSAGVTSLAISHVLQNIYIPQTHLPRRSKEILGKRLGSPSFPISQLAVLLARDGLVLLGCSDAPRVKTGNACFWFDTIEAWFLGKRK